MNISVCFIKRKRLPDYNSIEELFGNIISEIDRHLNTSIYAVQHSGGSPMTLLKNIWNFKTQSDVYHITGDVHYMAMAFRKNTILTIHDVNSAFGGNIFKNFYIKLFWFWLPALAVNRISVISEFTKKELSQIIPFAKHKIQVIPNPVSSVLEPSIFEFRTDKPRILLIGTKSNKNLERSIAALQGITCKVVIVGKLSQTQNQLLKEKAIDFDNYNNLTYIAIIEHYILADLVCFPSTYEGFGMPIVEAQAIGRPVLTSNMGAMAEVAGEGAYLVNPFEVNAIRDGVLELINNETLRLSLIKKGFENVQRFQTKHIAKQYINLYTEMVNS